MKCLICGRKFRPVSKNHLGCSHAHQIQIVNNALKIAEATNIPSPWGIPPKYEILGA